MRKVFFLMLFLSVLGTASVSAQVKIGSNTAPDDYSLLDLDASVVKRGLHLPRLSTTDRDNLIPQTTSDSIAAKGLLIHNTDIDCQEYWNGTTWISLCYSLPNGTQIGQTLVWDGSKWIINENRVYKSFMVRLVEDLSVTDLMFYGATESFIEDGTTKVVSINPVIQGDGDFIAQHLTLTYTANVLNDQIVWTLRVQTDNLDEDQSVTLQGVRIIYDSTDTLLIDTDGVYNGGSYTEKVYVK